MPKQYRKQLTFQSGELSPKFYGRSDDPVYDKGLAIAENVYIDKRGGVFRVRGTEHINRVVGENGRLFTLQVNKTRYYKIAITNGKMNIIAPGATLEGHNVIVNGDFKDAGASWTVTEQPASSQVVFDSNQVTFLPEQNNAQLVDDGDFDVNPHAAWTVRESNAGSDVDFSNDQCVLTPDTAAGEYAGIAQQLITTRPNFEHQIVFAGNFASGNVRVRIGTAIGTDEYLDEVVHTNHTVLFTPLASPYWITIDCEHPNLVAVLDSVKVIEPTVKTAEITQQLTISGANIQHEHSLVVSKDGSSRIIVGIGTTPGTHNLVLVETATHEIDIRFTPHVGTIYVTIISDGDNSVGGTVNFIGIARTDLISATTIGHDMSAPWRDPQLREIHIVELPAGNELYFLHPNVPPQKLVYNRKADTFTDLAPVVFTDSPAVWTGQNWPATGAFFQGRLWLAATPDQGHTLWGSRSGDYDNFKTDTGGTPTPASALEFPLAKFGRIEWIIGTKNLIVGAENGEHIVDSEGGVVTNADHNIDQQSSYGSNDVQAIQVAEKIFYVTPDGSKVRAMSFDWQEDNWLSHDLTFASEHMTKSPIRDAVWMQNPDNLYVVVLEDGSMAFLTYDRTGKTVGWTRVTIPGFHVFDVATGMVNGVNELSLIGQRLFGTVDIEVMTRESQYLGSYIGSYHAVPVGTIDGLEHLEGAVVRALVDGAVEPETTVLNGEISLQNDGSSVFVGVPYKSKIKTLPPDVPDSEIRSYMKRWNKTWALLMDSKQPIINGVRPPDRTPSSPMDHTEPDRSTHFKTVNIGWDEKGQVTIEQDLPVAMNILGIYGELNAETL